ncbi:MAG: hypothetical protein ABI411_05135 [Tahibacter sp.]
MLPFVKRTIEFSSGVDARQRLLNTLARERWSRLKDSIDGNSVQLEHRLPFFFTNSWNPIFQGRIESSEAGQRIVGYFRFNWFVSGFSIFFVGYSFNRLLRTYLSIDVVPGNVSNWRTGDLAFDLQFFAMGVAIIIAGWAIGIPINAGCCSQCAKACAPSTSNRFACLPYAASQTLGAMANRATPKDGHLFRVVGKDPHYIWSPIEVSDLPQARDEYDGQVGAPSALLRSGASNAENSSHLQHVACTGPTFQRRTGGLAAFDPPLRHGRCQNQSLGPSSCASNALVR